MAEEPRKGRPMDNPKCDRCGCRYSNHQDDKPHACKTSKLAGWDDDKRQFTRQDRCGCPSYTGPEPVRAAVQARAQCPHECIVGSRICVICKSPVPVQVRR